MAKPAERKTTKAMRGQALIIRSRIPTATHAAATSVAQIEFAASQNRQEVTKLDAKERDEATESRLRAVSGENLLTYRLAWSETVCVMQCAN
jgi:surface antigen